MYDYDPGMAQQQRQQMQMLFAGITNIRADAASTPEQKRERIQRLADGIVSQTSNKAIQAVDDFAWPAVVTESVRVLDEVMHDRVRQADLPALPRQARQPLQPHAVEGPTHRRLRHRQ